MEEIDKIGSIWRRLLGNKTSVKPEHAELYLKRVELLQKLPSDILECGSSQ